MSGIKRRKRLADGTFGPFEVIFESDTVPTDPDEALLALQEENERLRVEMGEVNSIINILLGGEEDEE